MKQIALIFMFSLGVQQVLISQDIPLRYRLCTGCSPTIGVDSLGGAYSYGALQTFVSHDVTSDYGPRERNANNGTYNWHKGIDCKPLAHAGQYNGGRGTVLLAPISGRIFRVSANQGYKHLAISEDLPPPYLSKGIGIGHIFNSRNPNAFDNGLQAGHLFLKEMDSDPGFYAIINRSSNPLIAIGETIGTVTFNGVQYAVITEVADSMVVAPMGGSGGTNYQDSDPYATHFHIDYYRNVHGELGAASNNEAAATNRLDPFLVLEHEIPEFDVRIQSQGQDFGNIQLKYPGSQPTKFRVRPVMEGATNASGQPLGENGTSPRYGNVAMNVDNVDVMIKSSAEADFAPIIGKSNEGRMSHGGRPSSIIYPPSIYQSSSLGNYNKQGIDPFAYHDTQGYPYDDYYFPDFYTRIHKDHSGGTLRTAELPANARYPDGEYAIFAQVTNIRDQVTSSDTLSFTLDNFKPYVQRVEVSQSPFFPPGAPFYTWEWAEKGNSDLNGIGKLDWSLQREPIQTGSSWYLKIEAVTSEPMEELTLSIPALGADSASFIVQELENGTKWAFITPIATPVEIAYDTRYVLHFRGMDLNGNTLLNLERIHQHNQYKPFALPLRQDQADIWSPQALYTGIDTLHKLIHYDCDEGLQEDNEVVRSSGDCIGYDDVSVASADYYEGSPGWAVVRVDTSITVYDVIWTDEIGNIISNDTLIENLSGGYYCYEVWDTSCCVVQGCVGISNCANIGVTADVTHSCQSAATGRIALVLQDIQYPYLVRWQDGTVGTERDSLAAGLYQVTITDDRGCRWMDDWEILAPFPLCVDVTVEQPSCAQPAFGSIYLDFPNIQYYQVRWFRDRMAWNNPYGHYIPQAVPDLYCVQVLDTVNQILVYEGCFNIVSPLPDLNAVVYPELPSGSENGMILLDASASTLPLVLVWTGPSVNDGNRHDNHLSGLAEGEYCVTATDYNGCEVTECYEVPAYTYCEIIDQVTVGKPCRDTASGILMAIYQEQLGYSYAFFWSDGQQLLSQTATCGELLPGVYYLTVTKTHEELRTVCIQMDTFLLEEAPEINISMGLTPTCPSFPNGRLTVVVMQGDEPFMYAWSNGDNGMEADSLAQGIYTVTVSDAYGCTSSFYDSVGLSINRNLSYVPGCLFGDLSVEIESFDSFDAWLDTLALAIDTNHLSIQLLVPEGAHVIRIHTETCIVTDTINTEVYSLETHSEVVSLPCAEGEGGLIQTGHESDAPGSFSYMWSTGSQDMWVTDLYLDSLYCVTISNSAHPYCEAFHCTDPDTLWYVEVDSVLTIVKQPCRSVNNGAITPYIHTNALQLEYQWSHGPTTKNVSGLYPGTYCLSITDITGTCFMTYCFTLTYYDPFVFYLSELVNTTYCSSGSFGDGEIHIGVYNYEPTNPVSIIWSSGDTTVSIDGLTAGLYSVTVSNGNGCSMAQSYEVNCCYEIEPNLQVPVFAFDSIRITPLSHPDSSDGQFWLFVTTDPPYQYQDLQVVWKDMSTGDVISNAFIVTGLSDGYYCVEISNGCGQFETICRYIKHCPSYSMEANATIVRPCVVADPYYISSGSFAVNPSNGYGQIGISWHNDCQLQFNPDPFTHQAMVAIPAESLPNIRKTVILEDMAGCRDTVCIDPSNPNGASVITNPNNCTQQLLCNNAPIPGADTYQGAWLYAGVAMVDGSVCEAVKYCEFSSPSEGIVTQGNVEWGAYQTPVSSPCKARAYCHIGNDRLDMGYQTYPFPCCTFDDVNTGVHVNKDGFEYNDLDLNEVQVDSFCQARLYCWEDPSGPYYLASVIPALDTCLLTVYGVPGCHGIVYCHYDPLRMAIPGLFIDDVSLVYQIPIEECEGMPGCEAFTGHPSALQFYDCPSVNEGLLMAGPASMSRYAFVMRYDRELNMEDLFIFSPQVNGETHSLISPVRLVVEACDSIAMVYGTFQGNYLDSALIADDADLFELEMDLYPLGIASVRAFAQPGDQKLYARIDSLWVYTEYGVAAPSGPSPAICFGVVRDTGMALLHRIVEAEPLWVGRIGEDILVSYCHSEHRDSQVIVRFDIDFSMVALSVRAIPDSHKVEFSQRIGQTLYHIQRDTNSNEIWTGTTSLSTLLHDSSAVLPLGTGDFALAGLYDIGGLPGLLIRYDSISTAIPELDAPGNSALVIYDTVFSEVLNVMVVDLPEAAAASVFAQDSANWWIAGRTSTGTGMWSGVAVDSILGDYRVFLTGGIWEQELRGGIRSNTELNLYFYPNPVISGDLLLYSSRFDTAESEIRVEIYTMAGVKQQSFSLWEPSGICPNISLPAGIYVIKYQINDNLSGAQKLVVLD